MTENKWLSPQEVAEHLHVHVVTVRLWISKGMLPTTQFSKGGPHRISQADLDAFIQQAHSKEKPRT